ncbi:hypothetical protein KAFR_0E01280 [Kazachstania africana CBS 2517]|uniref:Bis(5'-adenosyl)-triphosphatase n=1 Tax=Kazachstania africana (strain ATCC 22294 / BCRC 22015 / CBS 2517 / CECT 1963 / NBRC 1671 / NRRL Y-8276) TaxID=1071382 RepID=H2AV82_KAZAF|nr:hypothetical protein KAFR_0E01280 [Kazachstania africana CBS 2517]CCF58282.1 hypothetical protein KAFR_0E01280 [Kazachstania africana CBS 2517]
MTKPIYFSRFVVSDQVFYRSKYSYALVNLRPIVPGHVLVVPYNTNVITLSQLSRDESIDYFQTIQLIQSFITWKYKSDAMNVAIQDGPEAGQSVPHLHTHLIPRFKQNNVGDKIYNMLNDWDARRDEYLKEQIVFKPDDQRIERSMETMRNEAEELNKSIGEFIKTFPELTSKWI